MRQSAIEWYHNEMESLRVNSEINNMDGDLFLRRKHEIFERAKKIEEALRREDTNHGYVQGWDDRSKNKEPMRPEILKIK